MAAHDIEAIEVDRARHVRVEFADGVTATFELAALRLACPCAECNSRRQGGRSVSIAAETAPDDIRITQAAMAGAWGLNLDWSDGHSTGIYAFERMRRWVDDRAVAAHVVRPDGAGNDAETDSETDFDVGSGTRGGPHLG
ncbi:DUF971 domain-containing protein [Ilumatobacter sp.]|uniref:DUF971 domain-containing protein n=1 Tax=Ilumatobacter sp. TaxID=1967498 RepID=UPI003B5258CC